MCFVYQQYHESYWENVKAILLVHVCKKIRLMFLGMNIYYYFLDKKTPKKLHLFTALNWAEVSGNMYKVEMKSDYFVNGMWSDEILLTWMGVIFSQVSVL